jgi:tetratricopeptide (TPR) repeat protein/DNA-binding SARP family transcriptional activator
MQRHVLAVLLYAEGAPVSVHTLVDRLWDHPPATAVDTVRSHVCRLRTRLQKEVGDGLAGLDSSPAGYRLRVAREHVEHLRFRGLVRQAGAAADNGDPHRAVELLREAEALGTTEPLAGFNGWWAVSVRARLEEERWAARESRIRLELGLGHHSALVPELRELAGAHPDNESIAHLLMQALYRCGRQREALDAYERVRRALHEDGIRPGTRLMTLHQRILRHDPSLQPDETPGPARTAAPPSPPDTLLRDIADFSGREEELAILRAQIRTGGTALPLTVIRGMAGVGKSTLALHAAHLMREDYPDGRLYVDLWAHSQHQRRDPADALATLLLDAGAVKAADLPGGPHCLEARAALWRTWTAHRRVLVVLDDARDAGQVRPLLPGAAGCRVLVTSRYRLEQLEGAHEVFLETPGAAEAVLMLSGMTGHGRGLADGEAREVVDLLHRHPLAIRLTADNFRHQHAWSVDDLLEQLTRTAGSPDESDSPLGGVLSAVGLSYAGLSPDARRIFRLLALHPGPDFTFHAATALLGADAAAVRRSMHELLDCHLLEEPLRGRYRFHDIVRAFGGRAARRDEPEAARQTAVARALDYYLVVADRADRLAHPRRRRLDVEPTYPPPAVPVLADGDEAGAWLDVERANLLAAAREARTGDARRAVFFPHVLGQACATWGAWEVAAELYGAALDRCREGGGRHDTARILVEYAEALRSQGAYEEQLRYAAEALELGRATGGLAEQAEALLQVGGAQAALGRREEALRSLRDAQTLYERCGDGHGVAEALNLQGMEFGDAGALDQADRRFQAMLAIHCRSGDRPGQMKALSNIGEVHRHQGRYGEAYLWYTWSLALARGIGGCREVANLQHNLGIVCRELGETEDALTYFSRALDSYRASSDPRCEAECRIDIATTCRRIGRHRTAGEHLRKADHIARGLRSPQLVHLAQLAIGETQHALGAFGEARRAYEEAWRIARRTDTPLGEARALDGIGRVVRSTEGAERARPWWERALALYDRLGAVEAGALRERLKTERE